jgi:hypothetical protein
MSLEVIQNPLRTAPDQYPLAKDQRVLTTL